MENLLENYLRFIKNWEDIKVIYYEINGSDCHVVFYTDRSNYEKENEIINIWDMLVYLNK